MNTQQNGVDKSFKLSATATGCGHESSQPSSPRGSANVVSDQSLVSVTGSGDGWRGEDTGQDGGGSGVWGGFAQRKTGAFGDEVAVVGTGGRHQLPHHQLLAFSPGGCCC